MRKASDIMTPNPEVVTPDEPLTQAARIMRDMNVGAVPVVDDRSSMRLTGMITDRDITIRHVAEEHPASCAVRDHMTSGRMDTARPEDDVDQVMQRMRSDQVRRIPIVEENDRIVGIIAQADLAVEEGSEQPEEVERTVEEISEPAEPER